MDLKKVENKTSALVRSTKQNYVIVKTRNGYRSTLQKLHKGNDYERLLTLEKGKVILYDSKGEKKGTILTPKKKPDSKPNTPESSDSGSKE